MFVARAIGCTIAIFSLNSFAAAVEAKIGEHFRVVPAADGTNEVTLVGNGLNYQDTNGVWIQSVPIVQNFPNAIVCTGLTYRVILATNLNSTGSVDLELPADPTSGNRERMISHPLGLAFYDPDSGATVLLAPLRDCSSQIVSNQVIFPDAFVHSNGIQASVTYTYGVGHFHQDVILTTKPAVTPSDFGMGPNARLEMLTEFEQSPEPEITESAVSAVARVATSAQVGAEATETDQTLNYGTMRMGRGRAFSTATTASPSTALRVTKQLVSVANQNFLTEDVPWEQAAEALQSLPSSGTNDPPPQASARHTMPRKQMIAQLSARAAKSVAKTAKSFKERLVDAQRLAPIKIAAIQPQPNSGFVMDYEMVQSWSYYTFQSGHTYLVSYGTQIGSITIESGAVIKYSGGDLEATYSIDCPTSGPKAVLTDINDDSVGEIIPGSSGYFTVYHTSYCALNLDPLDGVAAEIQNLDIRFSYIGIGAPSIEGNSCYVHNCWFFNCAYGVAGTADFVSLASCDFCQVDNPYPYDIYSPSGITYCAVDHNGNGLPDIWEMSWYGTLSQTASGDYDGDGVNNQQDYSGGASHKLELFTPLK